MADDPEPRLVVEGDPDPEHARFLDDRIYEFGARATGITDHALLAVSLRGPDGEVVGVSDAMSPWSAAVAQGG